MIKDSISPYKQVWLIDFEFIAEKGNIPEPVCLVGMEYHSGKTLRLWHEELHQLCCFPYAAGTETLVIAYYASAEMGCYLALGWEMPQNLLDLFTEFRNLNNGLDVPCGNGLLGALARYGEPSIEAADKESMRQLILQGEPYLPSEKKAILDYCETDVQALSRLLPKMLPKIDMPRALLRGRYMKAAAVMEFNGIPVDREMLNILRQHWEDIKNELISRIDTNYEIFEGQSFREDRFKKWLVTNDIPWPHLVSGKLDLKEETFREMARVHSKVAPLRELRVTLAQMRLYELAVGKDNRNRCLLSAFRSRTGRNQPSNNKFIFGPSVWLRSLIRPKPGHALAYIDWSQQEFGIAAALSGDSFMKAAYMSGDPYLAFAKQAGAVPTGATKESHSTEREQFKTCVLAVQYGMGEASLASRLNQLKAQARELLRLHHETYRQFWRWSDAAVDYAMLHGKLWTVFGWTIHIGENPNPRFIRNFPMQANGAEILRLACCLAVERGIQLCAPIHDAILIEATTSNIEIAVKNAQEAMSEASEIVLNGFTLNTDVEIIRYPDRYMDKRGEHMWNCIQDILKERHSGQYNNKEVTCR